MYLDINEDCPKCDKEMSSYYSAKSTDGKLITVYFECKSCNSEYRHKYKVTLDKAEELTL